MTTAARFCAGAISTRILPRRLSSISRISRSSASSPPAHISSPASAASSISKPEQFLTDVGDAAALIEAEQGAVEHMNEDHREAINLYATKLLGAEAADWRCTGCDPEGLDMQAGAMTLAAGFSGAGHDGRRIAQDAGAAWRRGAGEGLSRRLR